MAGVLLSACRSGTGGIALTAQVTPTTVSGLVYGYGTATTSPAVVTQITGGIGPYSYTWVRASGDSSTTVTANGQPFAYFSAIGNPGDNKISTWYCHITDSVGNSTDTNSVTVDLLYLPEYTGGIVF